jgi:hypothetical protein
MIPVPESQAQNARFQSLENECFGLVFAKTRHMNSGTEELLYRVDFGEEAGLMISI